MSETFFVDEFFVAENDTVTETVEMPDRSGVTRQVPITFKRSISLADQTVAQLRAVRNVDGKPVVDSAAGNNELLALLITAWPFTDRMGVALPITAENVGKLLGASGAKLVDYINSKQQAKTEQLDSFASASDAASS